MEANETCVQVALRVRPLISLEKDGSCQKTTTFPAQNQVALGTPPRAFTFDYVFDDASKQEEVYNTCVSSLVDSFLNGYNATILAYGQTGSGKTHTMGTALCDTVDSAELGIVPRVIRSIFTMIQERELTHEFEVRVGFVEIYKDDIHDLLAPDKLAKLSIREDFSGQISIAGLKDETVKSSQEMMSCLHRGSQSRVTSATAMNHQSSRSHAIFTVFLRQKKLGTPLSPTHPTTASPLSLADPTTASPLSLADPTDGLLDADGDEVLTSKFHFVDLAGSERLKRTGLTAKSKVSEGVAINEGLLALGKVIHALSSKASHVPFRDTKLTRLLQDSLGGNSRTLMVACISPADVNEDESLNTLMYASRARNIKNKPTLNRDPNLVKMEMMRERIIELETLLELKVVQEGVGRVNCKDIGRDKEREKAKEKEKEMEEVIARNHEVITGLQRHLATAKQKIKDLKRELKQSQSEGKKTEREGEDADVDVAAEGEGEREREGEGKNFVTSRSRGVRGERRSDTDHHYASIGHPPVDKDGEGRIEEGEEEEDRPRFEQEQEHAQEHAQEQEQTEDKQQHVAAVVAAAAEDDGDDESGEEEEDDDAEAAELQRQAVQQLAELEQRRHDKDMEHLQGVHHNLGQEILNKSRAEQDLFRVLVEEKKKAAEMEELYLNKIAEMEREITTTQQQREQACKELEKNKADQNMQALIAQQEKKLRMLQDQLALHKEKLKECDIIKREVECKEKRIGELTVEIQKTKRQRVTLEHKMTEKAEQHRMMMAEKEAKMIKMAKDSSKYKLEMQKMQEMMSKQTMVLKQQTAKNANLVKQLATSQQKTDKIKQERAAMAKAVEAARKLPEKKRRGEVQGEPDSPSKRTKERGSRDSASNSRGSRDSASNSRGSQGSRGSASASVPTRDGNKPLSWASLKEASENRECGKRRSGPNNTSTTAATAPSKRGSNGNGSSSQTQSEVQSQGGLGLERGSTDELNVNANVNVVNVNAVNLDALPTSDPESYEKIVALQEQTAALLAELNATQEGKVGLENQIISLRTHADQVEQEVREAQLETVTLRSDMEDAKSKVRNMEKMIAQREKDFAKVDSNYLNLQREYMAREEDIKALRQEVKSLHKRIPNEKTILRLLHANRRIVGVKGAPGDATTLSTTFGEADCDDSQHSMHSMHSMASPESMAALAALAAADDSSRGVKENSPVLMIKNQDGMNPLLMSARKDPQSQSQSQSQFQFPAPSPFGKALPGPSGVQVAPSPFLSKRHGLLKDLYKN